MLLVSALGAGVNRKAGDDQIWVCFACGRTSHWRYGFDADGKPCEASQGFDESCMMNAVLCHAAKNEDGWWEAVESLEEP